MEPLHYRLAADGILFVHALVVCFIVIGLLLTFIGWLRKWSWVRNPWFRFVHLVGVGIVVLQSWLGVLCPLTTWEMALRHKAGDAAYTGSFIAHWVDSLLYYRAPGWVFVVLYTAFGLLVVASWMLVPPERAAHGRHGSRKLKQE